jgi:glyoxylase-like metal-dependent hydrolase (beta-lactamase superfamily II)
MKILSIDTGYFHVDGGALFGTLPKTVWSNMYNCDKDNMCRLSMRCLLIEDDKKLILIDCGIGSKLDLSIIKKYRPIQKHSIEAILNAKGYCEKDVTDVILTHLHLDHCGGATADVDGGFEPAFTNATFWCSESHWNSAINPNDREKASFLMENYLPLQKSGQLTLISDVKNTITPYISLNVFEGHTQSMLVPIIHYKGNKIAFVSDLIPTEFHLCVSHVMSFDIRPLTTINEKAKFLKTAYENNYILFLEHDLNTECCTINRHYEQFEVEQKFNLTDLCLY